MVLLQFSNFLIFASVIGYHKITYHHLAQTAMLTDSGPSKEKTTIFIICETTIRHQVC